MVCEQCDAQNIRVLDCVLACHPFQPDPDQYNLSYGESLIHGFDHKWNWLDGHSDPSIDPAIVHFTTGGPVYPNWRPSRDIDGVYADEWERLRKAYTGENKES